MTARTNRVRVLWQRVRTEPKLGRNLLALGVVVAMGLGVGGYILGNQGAGVLAWPWEERLHFSAEFEEASAIAPGQGHEVRIAGVPAGAIEAAEVTEDGLAEVELSVEPEHTIYDNAELVLRPKSPLNEMYVAIDPGGPPGEELSGGETLPVANTKRPVQFDEVLGHLDGDTRDAMAALIVETDTALANAPEELSGGLSATDRVLEELRPVVESLRERKDKVAELISALSTISETVGKNDQRLVAIADTLEQTLRGLGEQDTPLEESLRRLPGVTETLTEAMGSVERLSGELDPTLENVHAAAEPLSAALEDLDPALERAGSVTEKASPVVDRAGPVVEDLRPAVADTREALPDVNRMTAHLDPVTSSLVPRLDDVNAFVYNTNSVASVHDGSGPIVRGVAQLSPSSIPLLDNLSPSDEERE
ncbi:MCE family protein [Haloechinothrix sp. YIM 98757]|uniref:MCE family protein n=1 Tax=Haloechinothrix aidingensis TaxID=2752311 RepID=A0A838AB92_9PSEU|nr:MlaD family protein [Haloechinothrix aidingensis]MBA0126497.1 MCE family protein [Haloechinothrix aidingensis]